MSYILDALRRAEEERQLGASPAELPSPLSLPQGPAAAAPGGGARYVAIGASLAALLAVLVAAGLWWSRGATERVPATLPVTVATPAPAPAVAALTPAPAAPVAAPPAPEASAAPAPPAPAAPPAAATPAPPAPAASAPAAAPPPAARPAATPPAPVKRAAPPPKPAPAPAPAPARPKPETAQRPAPIFKVDDLPASVRAELPGLHLAGITWSSDARLRMAIVNGQVLHEGDAAAPGLVLERIEQERTVWAFRGYRVAVGAK